MKHEDNLENVALYLMFGKATWIGLQEKLLQYGLRLRKGKTYEDFNSALKAAGRNGHGITEFEISYLKVALKRLVCKADKTKE